MKKLVLAITLFLAIAFLFSSMAEMGNVITVMKNGDWRFLLAAGVFEALWLVVVGATYASLYRIVGLPDSTRRLWKLASASSFANVIAPTGGVSVVAVLISDARKNHKSAARVTVIYTLFIFFEYTGFLCVLTLGLGILAAQNSLHPAEITASILLVLAALGLAIILYLAMISETLLGNFLTVCSRVVNFFVRPIIRQNWLIEDRARSFSKELAEGVVDLKQNPKELIKPLGLAIVNKALLILILWFVSLAFKVQMSAEVLVAGFSIGYLFLIVSPTPSGVGVMEGAMALAFKSLGIAFETATVITLAFRGITFWAPLVVGAANFRNLQSDSNHISRTV